MNDLYIALILSGILSVLLSFIQITADTKKHIYKAYFTITFFIYVIIMMIGNIITTLAGASIIDNYVAQQDGMVQQEGSGLVLMGPIWIWYSIFGVFGFEAIVKQINITLFDKGVLSINEWVTKAKKSASAATLEKFSEIEIQNTRKLANELIAQIEITDLNTLATSLLGYEQFERITNAIKSYKHIDQDHYIANILADSNPREVKAEIKAIKAKKAKKDK